jgi:protein phosphatase
LLDKDIKLLLCTDGLTDMVRETAVENILKQNKDIREAGNKLLQAALDEGGRDNVTLLLIDASGDDRELNGNIL